MNEAGIRNTELDLQCPQPIEDYVENYSVSIDTLDHGYIIRVGCKSFSIESKETLLSMITKYINNPGELQKQFKNKTLIIK